MSVEECLSVDNSTWKCDGDREIERKIEREIEIEIEIER